MPIIRKMEIHDLGAPQHLDGDLQPVPVAIPEKTLAAASAPKPAPDPAPSVPHESVGVPTKFERPVLPTEPAKKASTLPPPPYSATDKVLGSK